jgi:copper(I)-binding protein
MLNIRTAAVLSALALACCTQKAAGPPQISITGAWSRATVAGQSSAAAYLVISNRGDSDDSLISASTPVGQASLHSSSMTNGVMQMRPVTALPIAKHSTVQLKPDGLHIMIAGLKQPLRQGTTFPLTLAFQRSGARTISVEVRPATGEGAPM